MNKFLRRLEIIDTNVETARNVLPIIQVWRIYLLSQATSSVTAE